VAAERLQKILSHAGVSSRRAAEEMIVAGRVVVNGKVVRELGSRADPDVDEVLVDGVPVVRTRYRYVALNKPEGVVSTARDTHGRRTVIELVPGADEVQLHPVGRLDMDSEGLLLLTNDGHLTELLNHPRNEVEKEYLVRIDRPLGRSSIARLVRGIEDEGERLRAYAASEATPPDSTSDEAWLRLVLREGKKREIKRMLQALDRQVLILRRVRIGPLWLGKLAPGKTRELDDDEVGRLYAAATGTAGRPRS
jgi:23S rRNA pseudouridine2605 synthase